MSNGRHLLAWLLLGLLTVVGVGGAVLGVVQSPKTASLDAAVANTLAAQNYTEVVAEVTQQGDQTDYLVYQAPDRLGGYIENGSKSTHTYVYVIGPFEYQSTTVSSHASTAHLSFYRQASPAGAKASDPGVQRYLSYAIPKNVTQSGNTYTYRLTERSPQGGSETGVFTYTVSGQYISKFTLRLPQGSVNLIVSQVGSSPPVNLPAGYKLVAG